MTQTTIISAAVIALTLGIGGERLTPVPSEEPLSNSDIVIVTNDTQTSQMGDSAYGSAETSIIDNSSGDK